MDSVTHPGRPAGAGGGDADGVEYAGALAQAVFRALAAAADDMAALASAAAPELSALLVVWALQARTPAPGAPAAGRAGAPGGRGRAPGRSPAP
jgi:hypothetical protein